MPPFAALIADWILTGLWPIVGQAGTAHYTPVLFVEAGLALGTLSVLPMLARGGRWRRLFEPGLRGPFFMIGLFGSGLSTFIYIGALGLTTPANAAIMAQIEVLYSAALCAWLLRERVTLSQGAGSLLVVLGTGLIMARDLTTARWKGDAMILLTPWMYQVSHIYAKRLPDDLDAWTISAGRMLYGGLSLIPFSLWALARGPRWTWSAGGLALLAAQGIAMTAMNHVLWYLAIRRMDLAKATAIMLSYPALTVLFSWALGREPIQAAQLAGLGLTLGGAYWVSLLVLKAQPPTPAETSPLAPAG